MSNAETESRIAYARELLAKIELAAGETLEIALDLAATPRQASAARTAHARTITGALDTYRAVLAAAQT